MTPSPSPPPPTPPNVEHLRGILLSVCPSVCHYYTVRKEISQISETALKLGKHPSYGPSLKKSTAFMFKHMVSQTRDLVDIVRFNRTVLTTHATQ